MRASTALFVAGFVAGFVAAFGPTRAIAHHAFSTEFDASLEGEVEGIVTRVWWANPHIRYDVDVEMPDGSIEQWSLHPPGNLPTYRRENWTADSLKAGDLSCGSAGRTREDGEWREEDRRANSQPRDHLWLRPIG